MASLKDMRVRLASTKATQKITKAMQLVAASKLRRAQAAAEAARPYAERMEKVLGNIASTVADINSAPRLLAGAGEQPRGARIAADRCRDVAEHLFHALGVRPRGLGRHLRAPQLGRRDHLHGLGDLLRRLGRGEANAHVLEGGHFFSIAFSRTAGLYLRQANVLA